jgi:ABC-type ATPase with predicted acetyltransferase domain
LHNRPPEKWSIGLICGASGTGKTTIAKEVFGDWITKNESFTHKSVIDDMPDDIPMSEIEKMFYAVGFGSVPSWLKPYSVLSNGEQMRVRLAKALLGADKVCFDEFTSVVDRNVAKTLSMALKKCFTHYPQKQFIAVSCHKDIIEWLQPDWILDTDTMQTSFYVAQDRKENLKSENASAGLGRSLGNITI